MHIITPVVIDDAKLVSSSLTEDDHPPWNPGTNYAAGVRCIYEHSIYERVVAGATLWAPDEDGANWVRIGPTNLWAMFDQATGTQAKATSSITVTVAPGLVRALALLDIDASSVTVVMTTGATEIYRRTVSLNSGDGVYDWYSYFFSEITLKRTLVLTGLPPYSSAHISITVNGPGQVALGTVVVGGLFELGGTLVGMGLGMLDYSKKETDEFGATTLVERSYAKRMSVPIEIRTPRIDEVARRLALIRAKPVVWVGAARFDQSVIYGFFRDWSIDLEYSQVAFATINIEGLA